MERLQAFKYELRPNGSQIHLMRKFAGSSRYVYNHALELQQERYKEGKKHLSYADLCRELTTWRHDDETPWLEEAPAQALQQKLKDLDRAYVNFFEKRAEYPKRKKRGRQDSFRYPVSKQTILEQDNNRIYLPKIGWVRYRNSRKVLGTIKNVTVSGFGNKWYVSIQTEREVETPIPEGDIVGIDMGIVQFATLSDGTFFAPLNSFRKHESALCKAQQQLSHKVKFSNNWYKALRRVQSLHTRIARVRHDYLHKTSTSICKNHAIVCIEDLQVANMSASARGTKEQPGTGVKAKSGLNKSILDQGWGEFRRQLDYKMAWKGGYLIPVLPQNTSRTCPSCGHIAKENRQTQAEFKCVSCGFEANADVVGAINVLRAGHARLACEVNDSSRQQQEPVEVTQVMAQCHA